MRGPRTETAADDRGAYGDAFSHVPGEDVGADVERGDAVDHVRQSGVGLDDDRNVDEFRKTLYERLQPVGSESAVEASGIRLQRADERGEGVDVRAGQELAVRAQRDGADHREAAVLARREERRLELVDVGDGLDCDEVRARLGAEADLLRKRVIGGVKLEIARGLQKTAGGAGVKRDELPLRGGVAGEGDGGRDDV